MLRGAMSWFLLILAAVAGCAANALALQETRPVLQLTQRFTAYLNSAEHTANLQELWQLAADTICDGSPLPSEIKPVNIALYADVSFDDEGTHPATGTWAQRYLGPACGRDVHFNFLFNAKGSESLPGGILLLPGTTAASPVLQRDALQAAYAEAATKSDTPCAVEHMSVVDTRRAGQSAETDIVQGAPWTETWTFRVCERHIEVEMMFIPSPEGGTSFVAR